MDTVLRALLESNVHTIGRVLEDGRVALENKWAGVGVSAVPLFTRVDALEHALAHLGIDQTVEYLTLPAKVLFELFPQTDFVCNLGTQSGTGVWTCEFELPVTVVQQLRGVDLAQEKGTDAPPEPSMDARAEQPAQAPQPEPLQTNTPQEQEANVDASQPAPAKAKRKRPILGLKKKLP